MVKEWSPLKEEIRQLYQIEKKPLHEVMRLVKGKHRFHASERSYRSQLRKWGYMKYSTESFPNPRVRNPRLVQVGRSSVHRQSSATDTSTSYPRTASFPSDMSFAAVHTSSLNDLYHGPADTTMMDTGGLPLADLNPLDLNQQDSEGKTRLHRATINGSMDEIKELLHSGAAVHLKDFLGNEPLQYAVGALNSKATDLLLRFGANANTKGNMGYSPLHLAVEHGAILDKLLFHGAAPCAQDDEGNTPLHIAISTPSAYSKHPKSVIDSLLRSGSDVNLANKAGITPFHKLLGHIVATPAWSNSCRRFSTLVPTFCLTCRATKHHSRSF
ncbi:ankyrin repeat-containing domain protein [Phialemonium atrogriseum]|uniref:Ankyrin repeat-containing domain protein n=1 Tax=Phialemonium atrogriseum TaxID=1093897 RepID=A0AAJ0C509_9PEZI|nr:ankyrin repeat-containing domain protein [Phialemonium atrogriseum]KAK1770065.1 ankyrin repeat-containing domain protein [Phialemonium atrogriseum]